MSKKIKIDTIDGGSDGEDLKGLYFKESSTAGQFNLYDTNNNLITTNPSNLTDGTNFSFSYEQMDWSITSFAISESAGTASGDWATGDGVSPRDDDESGSFQAQAGGSGDPEVVSTATA